MVALGSGIVVYVGPGATADLHRHDAIQIVWSPDRPVGVGTANGSALARAAIVPSRELHDLESDGAPVRIVLIEPSGPLGQRLDAFARQQPDLAHLAPTDFALPTTADATVIVRWGRSLVMSLIGDASSAGADEVRIELLEATRFIDDHLDRAPRLTDTAGHVGLSPRQLRRSFADEIGIPFRRYVLWRRLRRVLLAVRDGADLTTAATGAGFADSAHFSRTFRQTFGLTPSEILPLLTVAEADFVDG